MTRIYGLRQALYVEKSKLADDNVNLLYYSKHAALSNWHLITSYRKTNKKKN